MPQHWEPWMKQGVLYRALEKKRYLKLTYSAKKSEEFTLRIVWPKKIKLGRLYAEDVTPGKTPGFKFFLVDRITYAELLPAGWTPAELIRPAGQGNIAHWQRRSRGRNFVWAFILAGLFLLAWVALRC